MSDYDNPKDAPWNEKDAIDCPECHGTGKIPEYFCVDCQKVNHEDPDYCPHCKENDIEKIGEESCDRCIGFGKIIK